MPDTRQTDSRSLVERLREAQVGSCSCQTKTPDLEHHRPDCRYRLFVEAEREITEQERSFKLRWSADQRAIKRWRAAHPEKANVWPDHADLCLWMMHRLALAEQGVIDISVAIDEGTHKTPPVDDEYRNRRETEFKPLG